MRGRDRLMLVSAFTLAAATMLPAPIVQGQDRSPTFPFGNDIPDSSGQNTITWQSGDAPYSTYISPNYSFWAFSDTFLGNYNSAVRSNSGVVGNSIAIGQTTSTINAGNFTPFYFYQGTTTNRGAFFPNQAPGYRYSPRRPIMVNGKLFVFLNTRYVAPGSTDSNGQFLGNFLARVNNPTDLPSAWRIDYFTLNSVGPSAGNCPLVLGLEAQVFTTDPNNLYVYGHYDDDSIGYIAAVVVTLDINQLCTLSPTANNGYFPQQYTQHLVSYDGANPTFAPGLISFDNNNKPVYFDTQIPMYFYSLRLNSTASKWQLVGIPNLSAGPTSGTSANTNQSAYVFLSPNPFGPFGSSSVTNAILPAFAEFNTGYDTSTAQSNKFIYCAREWVDPSLTNDYQIAMTYTYDSANEADNLTDNATYTNRFASTTNPLLPPPAHSSQVSSRTVQASLAIAGNQAGRVNIPWEQTAAAAAMPKPLPTPVSGFVPLEQRHPWEIDAEAKIKAQAAPRGKTKLKAR